MYSQIKQLFYTYFSFLLVFYFIPQGATAQSLNYKQGQLIVQLKSDTDWETIKQKQLHKRSKSSIPELKTIRKLVTNWNIWLVEFDYTHIKYSEIIEEIKNLPEVLNIQKNHLINPRTIPNDPFFTFQWHHLNDGSNGRNPQADFDSEKAWDYTTGGLTDQGDTIVICIIDDGLEWSHEDLVENLWLNTREIPGNAIDDDQNGYVDDYHGWNTFKGNDIFDPGKHGTPVCGLAAARGNNSKGISGICWNTKIMFVAGGGDEANALESYAYPLLFRRLYNQSNGKKGAFVVATNSSWGTDNARPEDAPLWCAIYDSLGVEGILNVASTTNQNVDVDIEGDLPTTCESDFLLAVTNMNDSNIKDSNAGFGKKSIDLGAFGESVYSTYINNGYRTFSGTSAASPQVSGAIALLYSLSCNNLASLSKINPPEAAKEAKRILINSVKPNESLKNITVSNGALNLIQALLYTSPVYLQNLSPNSLEFNWESSVIYPIKFRYRIKDISVWVDTFVYAGNVLKLEHLESCTEYEMQFKNACSRYTDSYSPIRIFKTSGCCEAPYDFKVIDKSTSEIKFSFEDPSAFGQLTTLLRLTNSLKWDTFIIQTPLHEFLLKNLEPCAQYELRAYNYCNNKITPISEPFFFNVDGCNSCSSLDYCRRFRPSSDLEWLEAINVDNQRFKSGNNIGYGNFVGSNQTYVFEKNKSYSFAFEPGYFNDTSNVVIAAWIDFNQDGFFDSAENFALPTVKFKSLKSYVLSIPTNAKTGYTRMRICLKYAEVSETAPLSCFQSIEFGEYEDYCVFISNSICNPISKVEINRVEPTSADISVTHNNNNNFYYSYRKLYSSDWLFGTSNSKNIQLTKLDSCSLYEVQFKTVCAEYSSKPVIVNFRTPGTGCIINSNEIHPSQITIYPNPFSDQIFLSNPENEFVNSVRLFSSNGILIKELFIHANAQNLSVFVEVPAGYYFMQLFLKNGKTKVHSLIKQ
ncbi:MAG: S8 family peptidase [Saprospiraceae bacterium]|nr:S8 family peptidase [Saprospiraceae bacterium]